MNATRRRRRGYDEGVMTGDCVRDAWADGLRLILAYLDATWVCY